MSDLSVREVAAIVALHPDYVRRLIAHGRIPGGYRVSGVWRVRRETFDAMRGGAVAR